MTHINPTVVYDLPWRRAENLLESDTIILSKPDGSGGNVYVTLADFKEYVLYSGASPYMSELQLYNYINSQPDVLGYDPDYIVGDKDTIISGGPFFQKSLFGTCRPRDFSSLITVCWDKPVPVPVPPGGYPYLWQPQLDYDLLPPSQACRLGVLMRTVEDQPTVTKLRHHVAIYLPQTSFDSVYIINYKTNFRAHDFGPRIPPVVYDFKGRVGFASMSEDRSTVVDVTCISELFAYVLTWDEMTVGGSYLYYKAANTKRTWLIPIVWCAAAAPFFFPGLIKMETHYKSYASEFSVAKMV